MDSRVSRRTLLWSAGAAMVYSLIPASAQAANVPSTQLQALPLAGPTATAFDQATQQPFNVPKLLGFTLQNIGLSTIPAGTELELIYDRRIYDISATRTARQNHKIAPLFSFGKASTDGPTVTQPIKVQVDLPPTSNTAAQLSIILGQVKPFLFPYDVLRKVTASHLSNSAAKIPAQQRTSPGNILDAKGDSVAPPKPQQPEPQVWGAELKVYWSRIEWSKNNVDFIPAKILITSVGPGVMPSGREILINIDSRIIESVTIKKQLFQLKDQGNYAEIIERSGSASNLREFIITTKSLLRSEEQLLLELSHTVTKSAKMTTAPRNPLVTFLAQPTDFSLRNTGALSTSRTALRSVAFG